MAQFKRGLIFTCCLLLTACAAEQPRAQLLPTLIPSPTAAIDMTAPERVANEFLDAWTRQDFAAMYQRLTFNNQQAITFEEFERVYQGVQNLMTANTISYRPLALMRESDRTVVFSYDLTLETNILGTIHDRNHEMRLILDRNTNEWRVAWSLGDIFPEMGNGATLRFQPIIPRRANIYDRDGEILADQNGVVVDVNITTGAMPDAAACNAALAAALNLPLTSIEERLARAGQNWVVRVGTLEPPAYLEHQATLEALCRATFAQRSIRRYLRGSLMPHILGNVGYPDEAELPDLVRLGFDAETIIGRAGIERSWDATLRGRPGGRLALFAPNGTLIRVLAEATSQIPESLWLTIDADLQEYVLRTLGEAYVDNAAGWGATSPGASAVVLDVNTGEVLALVSYPTYDGNALNPFPAIGRTVANEIQFALANDPRNPLLNRPTQGIYPSGSIMKVIDSFAATDSGILPLNYSYGCSGVWTYQGDRRFDWLAGGHGRVTLATGLAQSCNPFYYEIGFRLNAVDPFLLPNYARRMGLGAPTGLSRDLSEAAGTIPDPEWFRVNRGLTWTYSNAVNLAIGQGEVEVTNLQMTRLYAAVGNGGILYRPQLVRERGILDQRTFVATPEINGEFDMTADSFRIAQEGLCAVPTERYGTAAHIFRNSPLLTIGVCGKTGTAQAPGNRPSHAWFMAYAPKDNPQIAVGVMVENSGEGSAVAAPLVRRIMEYYFFGPF
jgi:penicillin-binding protein 2